MSLPAPPVPLDGHCTVIYNNTLYAFQSNAFQSLPLSPGAQWSQLPMGAGVNGARCVQASYNGQDALFVIGGSTNDSSLSNYPGFQKYIYARQQWESNMPQVSVTQNRQMHGAAYLNSTSSIIVYAGFQDDSYSESSETFTISTNDPYEMRAFPSAAPPVINPIVLAWNQSHAVMVGGDPNNKEVWLFSETSGWQQIDYLLPSGLPDTSHVQGVLLDASDGTKVLQLFNMSTVPNSVSTFIVQPADMMTLSGRAVDASIPTLQARDDPESVRRRRRQFVLPSYYPPYNGTLAPTTVHNGYALAQSPLGLVVVSGGVIQSPKDSLCVFNETGNTWVSADEFFGVASTSTSTPTPSSTSTPAPIGSASHPSNMSNMNASRNESLLILGAVLGSVFGFAALCIIALLLLRYSRQRMAKNQKWRTSNFPSDAKDRMDFADRGVERMVPVRGTFRNSSNNAVMPTQASTPLAPAGIAQAGKRGLFHKAGDSGSSANLVVGRKPSPTISAPRLNPQIQTTSSGPRATDMLSAAARTAPRTDEGWSTYFMNNNNATDLARLPPGYTRYETPSRPDTMTTMSQSDYTNSRVASSQPHQSAEVAPLNIRTSLYPPSENTWEHSQHLHPDPNGLSRNLQSPSAANFSHIPEESDDFLDGSSGQDSWTPVATSDRGSTFDRAASSVYDSAAHPHPGDRVRISDFPGVPTSDRTSQTTVIPVSDQRGLRSLASKDFAGGSSRSDERRSPEAGPSGQHQGPKLLPRPAGDASGAYRGTRRSEDMSWLNLGTR
ncbi:hypothetical protein MMC34_008024 [Xylographa carneopallida]|nr:hypothetical protein [Xylographa carneopallida]